MDAVAQSIRRALETYFLPFGFYRSLQLVTCDDLLPPEEDEVEVVIQAILGCDSHVSGSRATELLVQRLRESWTWKVVVKVLLVLHRVIHRTSKQWLKHFLDTTNTFIMCQSFREGEGTDRQAESHTRVIRQYSKYLQFVSSDLIKPNSLYQKDGKFDSHTFKDRDDAELFRLIRFYSTLMESCFTPFITETATVVVDGFCDLSASVAIALFKDGLHLYRIASCLGSELLDRFPHFHPDDAAMAEEAYEVYRTSSDQVQAFRQLVKKLPQVAHICIPAFETPPEALSLDAARRRPDNRSTASNATEHFRHQRRTTETTRTKLSGVSRALPLAPSSSLLSSSSSNDDRSSHRRHPKRIRKTERGGRRSDSFSGTVSSDSSQRKRSRQLTTHCKSRQSSSSREKAHRKATLMTESLLELQPLAVPHTSQSKNQSTLLSTSANAPLTECRSEGTSYRERSCKSAFRNNDLMSCGSRDHPNRNKFNYAATALWSPKGEVTTESNGNASTLNSDHQAVLTTVTELTSKQSSAYSCSPLLSTISSIPLPPYPHPTFLTAHDSTTIASSPPPPSVKVETPPPPSPGSLKKETLFPTAVVSGSGLERDTTSSHGFEILSLVANTDQGWDWLNGEALTPVASPTRSTAANQVNTTTTDWLL